MESPEHKSERQVARMVMQGLNFVKTYGLLIINGLYLMVITTILLCSWKDCYFNLYGFDLFYFRNKIFQSQTIITIWFVVAIFAMGISIIKRKDPRIIKFISLILSVIDLLILQIFGSSLEIV